MARGFLSGAVGTGRNQCAARESRELCGLPVRRDPHRYRHVAAAYDGRKRRARLYKPGMWTRPTRQDMGRQFLEVGPQGLGLAGDENKTLGRWSSFEAQKTLYGAPIAGIAAQSKAGLDGVAHDPPAAHYGADVPRAAS